MVSALSPQNFGKPDQVDLVGSYLGGQRMAQGNKIQQQNIKQNEQQISQADYEQGVQRLTVVNRLAKKVKELGPNERYSFVQSINPEMLQSVGIDPKQISGVQLDDNSLDALIAQTGAALPQTSQYRKESVSTNQGLMVFDPSTGSYVPAKGADGKELSAAQYDPSLQGQIAGAKAGAANQSDLAYDPEIKRREEQAAADVKLATQPAITTAVDTAANEADAAAKTKAKAQKDASALAVYEAGMKNLADSLEKTTTGPLAGRLPAVTSSQQTAEGAISAMAPVLKALFREAGEGTFTKEDQQILMDMLATRADTPEARKAKMQNVDALVKLKLQGAESGQNKKKLTYDPATGTFK